MPEGCLSEYLSASCKQGASTQSRDGEAEVLAPADRGTSQHRSIAALQRAARSSLALSRGGAAERGAPDPGHGVHGGQRAQGPRRPGFRASLARHIRIQSIYIYIHTHTYVYINAKSIYEYVLPCIYIYDTDIDIDRETFACLGPRLEVFLVRSFCALHWRM